MKQSLQRLVHYFIGLLWSRRHLIMMTIKNAVALVLRLYRKLPIPAAVNAAIKEVIFSFLHEVTKTSLYQGWLQSGGGTSKISRLLARKLTFTSLYPAAPAARAPSDAMWEKLIKNKISSSVKAIKVDVIIPVYRGYAETLACIYSVLSNKQKTTYELIVINDASPEPQLTDMLQQLAAKGLFTLLENEENLGFVQTVNKGMRLHEDRDVVLLNADTEVYHDWLDRMMRAAGLDKKIASVTPFSSNAEICSYPFFVRDNYMTLECGYDGLDRLASEVNKGGQVTIPTAVGFCMVIKRSCLKDVGYFDAELFGKGYGEENDFCRRAIGKGWKHVMAMDVFVRHSGGSSFQDTKDARVTAAMKIINRNFPDYASEVSRFICDDPVRPYRVKLDTARLSLGDEKAMLFISHNLGGGTERHIQDMAALLAKENIRIFILRPDAEDAKKVRLHNLEGVLAPNLSFDLDTEQDLLLACLASLRIMRMHVHHVIGFERSILDAIRLMQEKLQVPYDVTLHDYFSVCPRINLIDGNGNYCGEPELRGCESCIRKNGSMVGKPPVWQWRAQFGRFLSGAAQLLVPNGDVATRMNRYFPELQFQVRAHPESVHQIEVPLLPAPVQAGAKLRVALIGELGPHKGSALILACAKDALRRNLPIEFCVIGNSYIRDALLKCSNVTITGNYKEEEIFSFISREKCQLAFFASLWPETYSYTLSIAAQAGLFPVAFDLGAVAERIGKMGWGATLPVDSMEDAARVNDLLLQIEVKPKPQALVLFAASQLQPDMKAYYGI